MNKKVVLAIAILIVLGILIVLALDIYRLTFRTILDFENDSNNSTLGPGETEENNPIENERNVSSSSNTTNSSSGGGSGGSGGSSGGSGTSSSSSGGGGIAPLPEITRNFSSSTLNIGEMLTVTINIYLRNGETYYVLEDQIPLGFDIIDSGSGNTSTPNYIKWIEYQDAQSTSYTYILNATQAGNYTFTGEYFIEGFSDISEIGGDNLVEII